MDSLGCPNRAPARLQPLASPRVVESFQAAETVRSAVREDPIVPIVESFVREDWGYLRDECGLSGAKLDRWRLESVLHRGTQIVGKWAGVNHDHFTEELARTLPLIEAERAEAFGG